MFSPFSSAAGLNSPRCDHIVQTSSLQFQTVRSATVFRNGLASFFHSSDLVDNYPSIQKCDDSSPHRAPCLPTPCLPAPRLPAPCLPTPCLPAPRLPAPRLPAPCLPARCHATIVSSHVVSARVKRAVPLTPRLGPHPLHARPGLDGARLHHACLHDASRLPDACPPCSPRRPPATAPRATHGMAAPHGCISHAPRPPLSCG